MCVCVSVWASCRFNERWRCTNEASVAAGRRFGVWEETQVSELYGRQLFITLIANSAACLVIAQTCLPSLHAFVPTNILRRTCTLNTCSSSAGSPRSLQSNFSSTTRNAVFTFVMKHTTATFKLKYVDCNSIDCLEILYRHWCCQDDESWWLWWSYVFFSYSATMRLTFLAWSQVVKTS